MKLIRQIHIDNGKLGGIISIIINSMFIFNFITFINTTLTVYNTWLRDIIPLWLCVIIICGGSITWFSTYYTILYPSIMQFANRQAYIHSSPIKEEFDKLNARLDSIEQKINLKN